MRGESLETKGVASVVTMATSMAGLRILPPTARVLANLAEGERVVLHPSDHLEAGARVEAF